MSTNPAAPVKVILPPWYLGIESTLSTLCLVIIGDDLEEMASRGFTRRSDDSGRPTI